MKLGLFFFLLSFPFYMLGYEFTGQHYISSFYGCSVEKITNIQELELAMKEAAHASGASVLKADGFEFEGGGSTFVLLLSESHASIHTYPEHGACFIDLFTCGDRCSSILFEEKLRAYLMPERVESRLITRN